MLFGYNTEAYSFTIRKRFLRRRLMDSILSIGDKEEHEVSEFETDSVSGAAARRMLSSRRKLQEVTGVNATHLLKKTDVSITKNHLLDHHRDPVVKFLARAVYDAEQERFVKSDTGKFVG